MTWHISILVGQHESWGNEREKREEKKKGVIGGLLQCLRRTPLQKPVFGSRVMPYVSLEHGGGLLHVTVCVACTNLFTLPI